MDVAGNLTELESPAQPPLGVGSAGRTFQSSERRLQQGERRILVTDGIINRRIEGGGAFGIDRLRHAVDEATDPRAARTAMAIQRAITDCWKEPLDDDATVVVMAVG